MRTPSIYTAAAAFAALTASAAWAAWAQPQPTSPPTKGQPPSAPASPGKEKPAESTPAVPSLPRLPASPQVKRVEALPIDKVKVDATVLDDAVKRGIALLLQMQEGDQDAEWPYEGVYRVGGQIPVGYRVGGTSIAAMSLLQAPGYADDAIRKAAVEKAADFVCRAIAQPLMSPETYKGGYDVRVWGHIYGLQFLVAMKRHGAIPKAKADAYEQAIAYYLKGLHELKIAAGGGWNYASERSAAPFVTGPALQSLFDARAAGYAVDEKLITDGLAYLERARGPQRTVVYSGAAGTRVNDSNGVPGAMGRMCVTESTLLLAGRGSVENVRNAVDKFIEHWAELDKRRTMSGTHEPPYSVAPYYFIYAHRYAAQAIELLPEKERPAYREKVNKLLFSVRSPDGSWTDRVFKRTANFGTAFALMAINAPRTEAPATWKPGSAKP